MDVAATADNEVFLAADDLESSCFVQPPQVARHEPAVPIVSLLGCALVVEVTQHQTRAAAPDFPNFPLCDLDIRILLAPNRDFVTRTRAATGFHDGLRVIIGQR